RNNATDLERPQRRPAKLNIDLRIFRVLRYRREARDPVDNRNIDVSRDLTHRSQTPHEEEVGDVRHDLAFDIQRDEHAGLRRVDNAALLRLAPDRLAKRRQLLAGAQAVQKSLAQLARDAQLPQPLTPALCAADQPVARVDDPRAAPIRSHASLLARRGGVLSK